MFATVSFTPQALEGLDICMKWKKGHCASSDWI